PRGDRTPRHPPSDGGGPDHPPAAPCRGRERIPARRPSAGFAQGHPPTLDLVSGGQRPTRLREIFSFAEPHFIVVVSAPSPIGVGAPAPDAGVGVTSSQIFVSFVSGRYFMPIRNVMMGTAIGQMR